MAEQTTSTGKSIESYIKDTLGRAQSGATAAQTAGYPVESVYTQAYYAGIPSLYMYGDADQAEALSRMGDLYGAYGAAGGYNKTDFSDIEGLYGAAGEYDPANFSRSDYTAQNIQTRMNPYEELVANRRKARLQQAMQEGRGSRELEAIRNQAFGGSGTAIREAMANRDYMNQLADMDAESLSAAFESGAGLYGKEMADRFAAEQADEQSRQFGRQTELSGLEGLLSARQQTAAQEAAAKEAQFTALQGQGTAAQQQAGLAEQQKNMQLTNLAAMQSAGQQKEERALAQAQYPLNLAAMQGNVLGAIQGSATQVPTSTYKTSTAQNILGGLTAGAGILQGLGGISGIADGIGAIGSLFAKGGIVQRRYNNGGLAQLYPLLYRR